MAVVRICGFESQTRTQSGSPVGAEVNCSSVYANVVGLPRTGACNLSVSCTGTQVGYGSINGIAANGTLTTLPGTSYVHGFAFKPVTLPASNSEEFAILFGGMSNAAILRINSSGIILLYAGDGTTLVATGTHPLTAGNWYYIEIKTTSGNAYEVRINGTTEFSGTATGIGVGVRLDLGKGTNRNSQTVYYLYDDVYIDDADFLATTTAFPEVKILVPNAAGTYSGWTNGTGTTYAEVDEVPPDADGVDATYIQCTGSDDDKAHTFRFQSCDTGGINDSVRAIEVFVWARTLSTSGNSAVGVRTVYGILEDSTTPLELLLAYQGLHRCYDKVYVSNVAWTRSNINAQEVGMFANSIAQSQRFTAAYIFVLSIVSTGAGPPETTYPRTLVA